MLRKMHSKRFNENSEKEDILVEYHCTVNNEGDGLTTSSLQYSTTRNQFYYFNANQESLIF
jgi:hypothetical protein